MVKGERGRNGGGDVGCMMRVVSRQRSRRLRRLRHVGKTSVILGECAFEATMMTLGERTGHGLEWNHTKTECNGPPTFSGRIGKLEMKGL